MQSKILIDVCRYSLAIACEHRTESERGEGKGKRKKRAGRYAQGFRFSYSGNLCHDQINYLSSRRGVILNFRDCALELCYSCFKNQNKKISKGIFCIAIELKWLKIDLLCYFPGYR